MLYFIIWKLILFSIYLKIQIFHDLLFIYLQHKLIANFFDLLISF